MGYYLEGTLQLTTLGPRARTTIVADQLDHSTNQLISANKIKLNPSVYTPPPTVESPSGKPMSWRRIWVLGRSYHLGDVVTYAGYSWLCERAHAASSPPSDSNADWSAVGILDSTVLYGVDLEMMTDGQIIFRDELGSGFLPGLITDRNVDAISTSKVTGLDDALADKLNLSGGTMTDFLTLVGNPTSANHAANKTYVDTFLPKSGGTMTGFLTLNAAPTSANHAATKAYVDGILGPGFLALTGGTMTGALVLSGPPTIALHAVTKAYADGFLPKSGGNMTGALSLSGLPTSALHATTKSYVDQFLLKSGGTMAGPITLSGAPTINNHAATKVYVDTAAAASRTFVGKVSVPEGTEPTDPGDLVPLGFLTAQSLDSLQRSGGTMTGFIVLHANPTSAMHATTKQYTDAAVVAKLSLSGGPMTGAITGAHGLFPIAAGSTNVLGGELSLYAAASMVAAPKTGLGYSTEWQVPHYKGKVVSLVGTLRSPITDYIVLPFDGIIDADSSSVAVVIKFNSPASYPLLPVTVRKSGVSNNAPVYINVPNADGRNSLYVLSRSGESITLWPTTSQWVVMHRCRPSADTFTVLLNGITDDAGVQEVLWDVRGYQDSSYPISAVTDEGGGLVGFDIGTAAAGFQEGDVFTVSDSNTYDEEYVVDAIVGNVIHAEGTFVATSTGQLNAIVRPPLDGSTAKIVHVRVTDSLTDPWTLASDISIETVEGDEVHPGQDAAKVIRARVTGQFQVDITNTGDPRVVYCHVLSAGEMHGHVNGGFDSQITDTIRYASNITAAAASGANTVFSTPHTSGYEVGDVVAVTGTSLYDGSRTVVSKTSNTLTLNVSYTSSVATGTITSANAVSFIAQDPSGFAADQYIYVDGITAIGSSRTALQLAGVVPASSLLVARQTSYDSGLIRTGTVGVLPVAAVEFT